MGRFPIPELAEDDDSYDHRAEFIWRSLLHPDDAKLIEARQASRVGQSDMGMSMLQAL